MPRNGILRKLVRKQFVDSIENDDGERTHRPVSYLGINEKTGAHRYSLGANRRNRRQIAKQTRRHNNDETRADRQARHERYAGHARISA
jgi:hypothetical protein